jgi:sec-independent protein translocase protein TatB
MPSLLDSGFIFVLALLLFGPKKLPMLARELGKWIGEFRRASNEFKMQMEEELRISERADEQKRIADIEATAPPAPALETPSADAAAAALSTGEDILHDPQYPGFETIETVEPPAPQPTPIATNGELSIMPPSTGLPTPRTTAETDISPLIDSIPVVDPPHHGEETTAATESAAHAN